MRAKKLAIIRQALRFGGPSWLTAAGIGLAAAFTATQAATPLVVAQIIDKTLEGGDTGTLLRWSIILALVAISSSLFREAGKVTFEYLRQGALIRLRRALLERLQRVPIEQLHSDSSGKLAALFMTDAPKVGNAYRPLLHETALSTLQLLTVISIVAVKYGTTVFLVLLLVPIYLSVPLLLNRPTRNAARQVAETEAEVHAGIKESIDLVREIKTLNRQEWNEARVGRVFQGILNKELRLQTLRSLFTMGTAAYALTVAFLYWYGGTQVIAGRISVGELIALVWFLGLLASPTNMLNSLQGSLQVIIASAHRVFDFLELPTEREAGAPGAIHARAGAAVEFRQVSFRYSSREDMALDRISFRIDQGQRVAVVGPSGSGKSTLINLLFRFYEPVSGQIRVHGQPIESYDLESLRQEIGLVPQEPRLFSVSLRENIRLGNLEASDDEVATAARIANAEEFITRLPGGFDMNVGEGGLRLSVGQKQRIAIARVVLRNPSILVLDEATSALDSESEALVREALRRVMADRTTIMVAHRLNTVLDSDRILVLADGKLVAQGRHQQLMETSTLYRRLVGLHFGSLEPSSSGVESAERPATPGVEGTTDARGLAAGPSSSSKESLG